jgi:hypothetical protein
MKLRHVLPLYLEILFCSPRTLLLFPLLHYCTVLGRLDENVDTTAQRVVECSGILQSPAVTGLNLVRVKMQHQGYTAGSFKLNPFQTSCKLNAPLCVLLGLISVLPHAPDIQGPLQFDSNNTLRGKDVSLFELHSRFVLASLVRRPSPSFLNHRRNTQAASLTTHGRTHSWFPWDGTNRLSYQHLGLEIQLRPAA